MSRPSIHARQTRDIAGVVTDMLGVTPSESPAEEVQERKTASGKAVEELLSNDNENIKREKTSFALLPSVKRHLSLLKLDLRSSGHKITEAEIVEILIKTATTSSILDAMKRPFS